MTSLRRRDGPTNSPPESITWQVIGLLMPLYYDAVA
jgi:hypothetical protein